MYRSSCFLSSSDPVESKHLHISMYPVRHLQSWETCPSPRKSRRQSHFVTCPLSLLVFHFLPPWSSWRSPRGSLPRWSLRLTISLQCFSLPCSHSVSRSRTSMFHLHWNEDSDYHLDPSSPSVASFSSCLTAKIILAWKWVWTEPWLCTVLTSPSNGELLGACAILSRMGAWMVPCWMKMDLLWLAVTKSRLSLSWDRSPCLHGHLRKPPFFELSADESD